LTGRCSIARSIYRRAVWLDEQRAGKGDFWIIFDFHQRLAGQHDALPLCILRGSVYG